MTYSPEQYLRRLRLAKRAPTTIAGYKSVLTTYAKFINVDYNDLHNHLNPEDLVDYSETLLKQSEKGGRVRLGILLRYFKLNGVVFDELERNILRPKVIPYQNDKVLTIDTLQKMMDLGDVHSRAIISFLISTGLRARELCQLKLNDVNDDVVAVSNEIAKGGRGGTSYLTLEAQEFLLLWLKDREKYLTRARTKYYAKDIPANDDRLFCVSYPTLRSIFTRLYRLVDGERGPFGYKVTVHSCRRYFRSNLVKTVNIDVVEHLLRHTGYLTEAYRRYDDEVVRREFHKGEYVLYLTRPLHRQESGQLLEMEQKIEKLERTLKLLKISAR